MLSLFGRTQLFTAPSSLSARRPRRRSIVLISSNDVITEQVDPESSRGLHVAPNRQSLTFSKNLNTLKMTQMSEIEKRIRQLNMTPISPNLSRRYRRHFDVDK